MDLSTGLKSKSPEVKLTFPIISLFPIWMISAEILWAKLPTKGITKVSQWRISMANFRSPIIPTTMDLPLNSIPGHISKNTNTLFVSLDGFYWFNPEVFPLK